MGEPENLLLTLLCLLLTRQYGLSKGSEEPLWLAALDEPPEFAFAWRDGAFRCQLDAALKPVFEASLLVVAARDFVAPVTSLVPHVKLEARKGAARIEASIGEEAAAAIGASRADEVYAFYSPLQVLFSAETGFFLPRAERWHAYAARWLALRLGTRAEVRGDEARVSWGEGEVSLADGLEGPEIRLASDALAFSVRITAGGFAFELRKDAGGRLGRHLERFCTQQLLPAGVQVEAGATLCIRGGS